MVTPTRLPSAKLVQPPPRGTLAIVSVVLTAALLLFPEFRQAVSAVRGAWSDTLSGCVGGT